MPLLVLGDLEIQFLENLRHFLRQLLGFQHWLFHVNKLAFCLAILRNWLVSSCLGINVEVNI
jgi:hypothetical protein